MPCSCLLLYYSSMDSRLHQITYSTYITGIRIALTPVIVWTIVSGYSAYALALFGIAAFSDILDGWLARVRNECTVLGACLDPIADKLLIVSCYGALWYGGNTEYWVPWWFCVLVVLKELLLVFGVLVLYLRRQVVRIAPTVLGKVTMFAHVCFVAWLLACRYGDGSYPEVHVLFLAMVSLLTLGSLAQYVQIGWRQSALVLVSGWLLVDARVPDIQQSPVRASEFTVRKTTIKLPSAAKLRESIVWAGADLLDELLAYDREHVELRSLCQECIADGLQEKNFFSQARREALQELLIAMEELREQVKEQRVRLAKKRASINNTMKIST